MTCEEVKALLTDYLDKTLDTATTTRVATHLIACVPCGALAGDLAECINEVSALPRLDPPLGFAQRVMAHVRAAEPAPSLWHRLFLPWTTKLPLPATAVIMIGILTIFLHQRDDALKYSPPATSPAPLPKEEIEQPEAKPPAAADEAKEKLTAKTPAKSAQVRRAPERSEARIASEHQTAAVKSDGQAGSEESKIFRRAPIQVQEASSPSDVGRFTGGVGFAPAMPSFEALRQPVPRSAPLALERALPLGERTADYEYVVRRRPSPRLSLESRVEFSNSVDEAFATRPTPPAPAAPRIESIAEIRFYSVAPEHFDFFKKELASEAIVESESRAAAKERDAGRIDRHLLIKVTILPAAAPESSAPPR